MVLTAIKWFKDTYRRTVTSIAFLPAILALLFLAISFLMIELDYSAVGKNMKARLHWLSLKDADTARSICTAIAAGVISLTVFSFSMVMILLNQTASLMSNRILDKLIGNRFQQFVLGFYIGTIVYALFLLSTIRDINSGIYVPAISTYLLIAFTVFDIFLFIYFLHYVTQAVKYETIIYKIHSSSCEAMVKSCTLSTDPEPVEIPQGGKSYGAYKSGLFQGFDRNNLLALCNNKDIIIYFHYSPGTFLLKGTPLISVQNAENLDEEFEEHLKNLIYIERGQEINLSYLYGFKQLMEIAIKALSPGINDPDTAVISLQALADLLAYRLQHFPDPAVKDKDGKTRIITTEKNFEAMFNEYIMPIWDYGKEDRLVQKEMLHLLTQLSKTGKQFILDVMIKAVEKAYLSKQSDF